MTESSETPIKIKDIIREQITSEVMMPGQKLPSEREMTELFSTTRITLKDALIGLETEGLIYREERRGWYVSPERLRYNPLSRSHFHKMVREQSRVAKTKVITVRSEMASGDIAKALEVSSFTPVHVIERVRLIDGRAVLFVENCLIEAFFPNILTQDLSASLTELYQIHYGFETLRSRFEVIPTAAPAHAARALNLAAGQPVLKICRVNYNQNGQLIDCEFEYWRPDSVMICIDSQGEKIILPPR